MYLADALVQSDKQVNQIVHYKMYIDQGLNQA